MKKSEYREEISDLKAKLSSAYWEINNLKLLLKAGEILDDEEENPHANWDRSMQDKARLKEKEQCPIDLERVAAAI